MKIPKILSKLSLFVLWSLLLVQTSSAGQPGGLPDGRTYSGGASPFNRGGYSPKNMEGVIRGDGTYMTPAPGRETYWGKDIYAEENEEGSERSDGSYLDEDR